MDEWLAILIGCLVAVLYLALAHVLCWGKGGPIPAYIIGTIGLNLGSSVIGVILQNWMLVVVPWIVAFAGGATVVLCHQIRGGLEAWGRRSKLIAQVLEITSGTARKPSD
jgi:hypothetical protein